MIEFTLQNGLYVINTFVKKHPNRKCTWASPDGITKNEIDLIMTDKNWIIRDVQVLDEFSIGSDHRIVRTRIEFNLKSERRKRIKKRPTRTWEPEKPEEYRAMVAENLGNLENREIEDINNYSVTILTQAIKESCPKKDNQGNTKLTQNTKDLIKQRRVMTNQHSDDYRKLNKKI
ncbi:uncharacterized protein LOC115874488 [Sitophilus oryzae]|uniref:Uncharacterized protein LOC115874488 n=1 Tax=Sitophilus oryzae TaxID=7048 RepID=A0A6J2X2R8_SITOR|nr:uncharacterized protein LOC115874488 [Sitophilus oryzae]